MMLQLRPGVRIDGLDGERKAITLEKLDIESKQQLLEYISEKEE